MEKQRELFGDFQEEGFKKRVFGKGVLPSRPFTFIFTYEKLILIILGFIVVLAITFAFGFECGRRSTVIKTRTTKVQALPIKEPKKQTKEVKTQAPELSPKPYTIQVATFKSKQLAQQEAAKLKGKGFSTTIIGINGLYEVWAGEYRDPKEASAALSSLKKVYKDCFIRKR